MKMNQCFTSFFQQTMKEEGFKKVGLLYYRVQGVMLQGVLLKTCNPFQICFSNFPYWLYPKRNFNVSSDFKKGCWTQGGGFMYGFYYNPQTPEENEHSMQETLCLFKDTVLPYFNSIKNEEEYFLSIMDRSPDLLFKYRGVKSSIEGESVYGYEYMTKEILLHQKYFGLLPDSVENYLSAYYEKSMKLMLQYTKGEEFVARETQQIESEKAAFFSHLNNISEQEFKDWYDVACTEMKQMLRVQLKLEVGV